MVHEVYIPTEKNWFVVLFGQLFFSPGNHFCISHFLLGILKVTSQITAIKMATAINRPFFGVASAGIC